MNGNDVFSDFVSDEKLNLAIALKKAEKEKNSEYCKTKKETSKGHRERVKKRFLQSGLTGFAQHEVLEILLFYCLPQRDTKQIAHELIGRFGSVAGVLDADIGELVKVKYVTENAAALFKLIPQITSLYYSQKSESISFDNSRLLTEMFRSKFLAYKKEVFLLACFDNDLKLIGVSEISSGSASFTVADINKMASAVLKNDSTMAAVAHNHPGCSSRPSDADVALTRHIAGVFRDIGVTLMDHIIIGASDTYSMMDNGDLGGLD